MAGQTIPNMAEVVTLGPIQLVRLKKKLEFEFYGASDLENVRRIFVNVPIAGKLRREIQAR